MPSYPPYRGEKRKLILAFEVGTTYSAISYCILDPGHVPEIKSVSTFPGLEVAKGPFRIPTIIYYDRSGNVKAVGTEAVQESICEKAEDEEWVKAEWFKLHLGPKLHRGPGRDITSQIPALPLGKTAVAVLSDFYAYLLTCTSNYIRDVHTSGLDLWRSLKDEIEFVITHPNGWESREQSAFKQAAVLAKLIPDTSTGHGRLHVIADGEANLYTALPELPVASIEKGDGVVVVEAGSGTIDVASYGKITGHSGGNGGCEELAEPQRHFQGSIFVGIRARSFLETFLEDSLYVGDLDHIVRCFDKTTKLRFRNSEGPQYIKFGSTRDNDTSCNIRFGQLKLSGADVASFFQPSIDCIVNAVLDIKKNAHKRVLHVVLVGEFAAIDWLFNSVQTKLVPLGLNVVRPGVNMSTTIPNGAISYYLTQFAQRHLPPSKAPDTQPKAKIPEPKPVTPASPSSTLDGSNRPPARGMTLTEMIRRL